MPLQIKVITRKYGYMLTKFFRTLKYTMQNVPAKAKLLL